MELDRVKEKERAILVGMYGPELERKTAEEHLQELALLTETAGGMPMELVLQHRVRPDVRTYVGKGKLDEIKSLIGEKRADLLIFDDDLSPSQARNIYNHTKIKVLDRSGLILDIFAARAKTAAAKTQVELAQLEYLLPRLTRYWTHLERQSGGIGTKGPGETQLETDRRLIGKRISTLKEKLIKLNQQRITQRKGRAERVRLALVGYTNAGKSTLMNALTSAGVYAEDKLFATLDATVRQLRVGQTTFLLSDTVGFIRKLPHGLVESFKSTLDEIVDADLLIHVVDAASPNLAENIDVVKRTLKEIGAEERPVLLVLNQIDKIEDVETLQTLRSWATDAVMISALRGLGLETLKERITLMMDEKFVTETCLIPYNRFDALLQIKKIADLLRETPLESGIEVEFRVARRDWPKLRTFISVN